MVIDAEPVPVDRNAHVKAYLAYYVGLPKAPHYAVLLDGAWGIGKTFLLKAFLDGLSDPEFRFVYVSLNGLASTDEIDDAIFRATFPLLDNRASRFAGRLVKSVAKTFRIETDLKLPDLLQRGYADLYVFDDLERCGLQIARVLGYVNELIEHDGRKVILVANQAEISNGKAYARIREKVIGKTLHVQSALEDALAAFLKTVADPGTRAFLTAKMDLIRAVYTQAAFDNLRLLQQTIWDFERFYLALDDRHRADDRAMSALLRMLFALSIELKAGRLKPDDLRRRQPDLAVIASRVRGQTIEFTSFELAEARYTGAELADPALSDETLIALLAEGFVDAAAIRADLDRSWYFVSVADEPAWRTVWHAVERKDAEVEAAAFAMERAFAARAYELPGEILHVFGLRLRLARIGLIAEPLTDVVVAGKRYVDDLYAKRRLRPTDRSDRSPGFDESGYDGLAIASVDTPEFQDLAAYLHAQREQARLDRYPEVAAAILADMKVEPGRFYVRLTTISGSTGEYARVPLLASLDPAEFVAAVLSLHPREQRTVLRALRARWEHVALNDVLSGEAIWAQAVRDELSAQGARMGPIGQERIAVFLRHTLDLVL
ncbi:P-loop NTPase fold protein [Methylobacterium sp. NPDC080182]|uniref:P-loop NTPase fold protein n=1 Tax=Methylobacterium sp. NPDC080182 TaxID=3390590 RepID=UPI003D052F32